MDSATKIQAIKELRDRCDIGLLEAKQAIEGYHATHPAAQFGAMVDELAAGLPPRQPSKEAQIAALRTENEQLKTALKRIAAGNPAKPGEWLSDIEMADIARAALE